MRDKQEKLVPRAFRVSTMGQKLIIIMTIPNRTLSLSLYYRGTAADRVSQSRPPFVHHSLEFTARSTLQPLP
jgi:hypothetical protein